MFNVYMKVVTSSVCRSTDTGNKKTIKICTYESGYCTWMVFAENLQCKISASLEACLRAHERKDI